MDVSFHFYVFIVYSAIFSELISDFLGDRIAANILGEVRSKSIIDIDISVETSLIIYG